MTYETAASKRSRQWAETHVGPAVAECAHEVCVLFYGVLTCTACHGRRLVV